MSDPDDDPQNPVWEQLPGEPSESYMPFCKYRDYGPTRSLDKVYWQDYPDPEAPERLHRHPSQWDVYSRRWQWVTRAAAYDAFVERKARKAREAAVVQVEAADWTGRRRDLAEKTYQVGQALLAKGAEMLQFPLATVQQETRKELAVDDDGRPVTILHQTTIVYPGKWTMAHAAAMVKTAVEALQFATGGVAEAEAGGGAGDTLARETQPLMTAFTQALDYADEDTRDAMLQKWEEMMSAARQLEEMINTTNSNRLPGVPPGTLRDFVPDDLDDA